MKKIAADRNYRIAQQAPDLEGRVRLLEEGVGNIYKAIYSHSRQNNERITQWVEKQLVRLEQDFRILIAESQGK